MHSSLLCDVTEIVGTLVQNFQAHKLCLLHLLSMVLRGTKHVQQPLSIKWHKPPYSTV